MNTTVNVNCLPKSHSLHLDFWVVEKQMLVAASLGLKGFILDLFCGSDNAPSSWVTFSQVLQKPDWI